MNVVTNLANAGTEYTCLNSANENLAVPYIDRNQRLPLGKTELPLFRLALR